MITRPERLHVNDVIGIGIFKIIYIVAYIDVYTPAAEGMDIRVSGVPQQDIVYDDLVLERMLMYAAQLRMLSDTTREERQRRIDEVIEQLGLTKERKIPIGCLRAFRKHLESVNSQSKFHSVKEAEINKGKRMKSVWE